ncbi:isochorismatase [Bryobacterales bacterium F-183]|nr:isochorismatase [Bryobacterales bacterium F-183]
MRTVYWDVDTQLDFISPGGALYVPGAEHVIAEVARLNHFASKNGIPLVSTMDAHPENDIEFATWPPHCIAGTLGQRKPAETLCANQIIFEKVTTDAFLNPAIHSLLRELAAEKFVVYGVVTEVCVRHAALGLLKTGAKVELATNAIRHLTDIARDQFYAEFRAAGGVLIS